MSVLFRLVLSIFLTATTAFAQDPLDGDDKTEPAGDRFVIPPDALSPLRRKEGSAAHAVAPDRLDEAPDVLRDISALPAPVRETRRRILEAARSGQIAKLRPLLRGGGRATQLTFDELGSDPIDFLLAASGDPEGHEMLAILIEVLEAGYVRIEDEDEGVLYVWPYFAAFPIAQLKPAMKVELFRLLTGGDYEEMTEFGAYIFYRVGIGEDGQWRFFLSGDG